MEFFGRECRRKKRTCLATWKAKWKTAAFGRSYSLLVSGGKQGSAKRGTLVGNSAESSTSRTASGSAEPAGWRRSARRGSVVIRPAPVAVRHHRERERDKVYARLFAKEGSRSTRETRRCRRARNIIVRDITACSRLPVACTRSSDESECKN